MQLKTILRDVKRRGLTKIPNANAPSEPTTESYGKVVNVIPGHFGINFTRQMISIATTIASR